MKDVPPVDLPDLLPFFQNLLALNHRRPKIEGYGLSFKTPEEWLTSHAIRRNYSGLLFDRSLPLSAGDLMGVGHPLMEKALQQASRLRGVLCLLEGLAEPLQVIAVSNRVTDKQGGARRLIFGITGQSGQLSLLKDWEVLRILNQCLLKADIANPADGLNRKIQAWLSDVEAETPALLQAAGLPFDSFHTSELALFWVDSL